ncbi:MAG: hypothetical protein ACKVLN_12305 [Rhodobacterales bacterium]|jgi:DHA1 family bicyclomycin/chloramphenicol resistance-like MFS transporter
MVLSRANVRDTVGKNAAASKIAYVTMGMAPMLGPALATILTHILVDSPCSPFSEQ